MVTGISQTGTTITDQMDLLREQAKMLAGEMALSTSSLKRLSEQAAKNPDNLKLKVWDIHWPFNLILLGSC